MERRYAVLYEESMVDAEVKPEALEGVLERWKESSSPSQRVGVHREAQPSGGVCGGPVLPQTEMENRRFRV